LTNTNNVLIAAVGGQGALLAARILGNFAGSQGLAVKISEIHGMSQRGGSVVTHVRYGAQVHSPVIEAGTADVIMAFEQLEAARYVGMLRPGGTLLVNSQRTPPLPVLTGAAKYPEDLLDRLGQLPAALVVIDALREAQAVGSAKTVNTILLGAYAACVGFEVNAWHQAVSESVPAAYRAVNLAAFDRGHALAVKRLEPPRARPNERIPS